MTAQTKIAFVGAGGIAGKHMEALGKAGSVETVGICDVDAGKAQARREKFGGQAFSDAEEMLDATKPDGVFICLPPHAHGPAEAACIDRRIPFLVEKPLANDLALAEKIASRVAKASLITAVGYMNRYRKGVQRAKELLAERPVSLIYGGWLGGTPGNHPWLTQKKLSGGQIVEQTTHTFDLLRYLCGEAAVVQCFAAGGFVPHSPTYDTDDASSVLIKMKSDAVANIMSSWSAGPGGGVFLTLTGPKIQISFTGWDHTMQAAGGDGKISENQPGEPNIFELEDRAFLQAIRTGQASSILCDYADGVESLRLSAAANRSIDTGKPVAVR